MAGSSLLALIDDITTVLDDVALLTKVAAKKTAGVVGDDLAVNANQVTGVDATRELPVVWAVAKGSLLNKAILVPAALAISAVAPWVITPLLMLGGLFLCYEAFEKVEHKFAHSKREQDAAHRAELEQALANPQVDLVAFERDKIKGAIRTDFILSAEIIAIALGTVAEETIATQAGVLVIIAIAMTVGVYGLVAGIVKLDDLGLMLTGRRGDGLPARFARALGRGILAAAPWLMKFLSVAGTLAMFLVGGGILVHGLHVLAAPIEALAARFDGSGSLVLLVANLVVGILAGALVLGALALAKRLAARRSRPA
jgi:predicted DNA repair protein MutK